MEQLYPAENHVTAGRCRIEGKRALRRDPRVPHAVPRFVGGQGLCQQPPCVSKEDPRVLEVRRDCGGGLELADSRPHVGPRELPDAPESAQVCLLRLRRYRDGCQTLRLGR
jgi:hypothetical protein